MKTLRFFLPFLFLFVIGSSYVPSQKTWVALGDSITYLNNHLNETGNRVSKGYMTIVNEEILELHYINQGHNGWTAKRIAENIEKLKIEKAELYTIFLGTNDWWAGIPAGTMADYESASGTETVAGSFRVIIDRLKSKNPNAKFILISPMQRGDFVYINSFKNNAFGSYKEKNGQSLESIANVIVEIAKYENYEAVDLYHNKKLGLKNMVKYKRLKNPETGAYQDYTYPGYVSIPFDPAKDEYPYPEDAQNMTYDGLHPSDKGNELIAKLLIQKIKSLKL
ncbi:GDSL-like Lipase/Acylhydrolase [Spirosomataceae bacterium TFI 002]|nr:GDSL-like Lipase/Acylhydrolase [Spirosomataceae bacterium TFI 002]